MPVSPEVVAVEKAYEIQKIRYKHAEDIMRSAKKELDKAKKARVELNRELDRRVAGAGI